MSARKAPIEISVLARRDINDILLYTREQWGAAKRSEYRHTLDTAFATLHAYPELGRSCEDLSPGLRAYSVERHVVYYRLRGPQIYVSRVLHARRAVSQSDIAED